MIGQTGRQSTVVVGSSQSFTRLLPLLLLLLVSVCDAVDLCMYRPTCTLVYVVVIRYLELLAAGEGKRSL